MAPFVRVALQSCFAVQTNLLQPAPLPPIGVSVNRETARRELVERERNCDICLRCQSSRTPGVYSAFAVCNAAVTPRIVQPSIRNARFGALVHPHKALPLRDGQRNSTARLQRAADRPSCVDAHSISSAFAQHVALRLRRARLLLRFSALPLKYPSTLPRIKRNYEVPTNNTCPMNTSSPSALPQNDATYTFKNVSHASS